MVAYAKPTGAVDIADFRLRYKAQSGAVETSFTVLVPHFLQPDFKTDGVRANRQRYKLDWFAENITSTNANLNVLANRIIGSQDTTLAPGDNSTYIYSELTTTSTTMDWGNGNAILEETEYSAPRVRLNVEDAVPYEDRIKEFGWVRLGCTLLGKESGDVFDVSGMHIEMINDYEPTTDTHSQEIYDGATAVAPYYKNKPVSSYMLMHMATMLRLYSGEGRMYWTLPLVNTVDL